MPVHPIYKNKILVGFKWGNHGKLYTVRKYGKAGARKKSLIQQKAIFSSGFKGK